MIILKKGGGAYGPSLLQLIKRRATQQEACEHAGMQKIPTRTSAMSCTHHTFESSVEVTHPTLCGVGARCKVLLIEGNMSFLDRSNIGNMYWRSATDSQARSIIKEMQGEKQIMSKQDSALKCHMGTNSVTIFAFQMRSCSLALFSSTVAGSLWKEMRNWFGREEWSVCTVWMRQH